MGTELRLPAAAAAALLVLLLTAGHASCQAYDDYDYYGEDGEDGSDFSRAQKYSGRLVGVLSSNHHQVRLTFHTPIVLQFRGSETEKKYCGMLS